MKGVGLGALGDQLAVDLLGLLELLLAVVDETEQVEDPDVAGAKEVGLLELPLGVFEPPGLEQLRPLLKWVRKRP